MTDLMRRIRRAVLAVRGGETDLRAALNELGISSSGSGTQIMRRVRKAILTDGHDEQENLRSALSDLHIGGGLDEPRPIERVRRAILRPPRNSEALLRNALDDLGVTVPAPSGGGGEPEPSVFADFKNGVYTIGGAPVAIGDIFIEDEANWATWNPAVSVVGGVGLVGDNADNSPVVANAVASGLLSGGFTVLIRATRSSGINPTSIQITDFPAYTYNWRGLLFPTGGEIDWEIIDDDGGDESGQFAGATVVAAITFTESNFAICVNGGAVTAFDPGNNATRANIGIAPQGALVIESLAFYSPALANGELAALTS